MKTPIQHSAQPRRRRELGAPLWVLPTWLCGLGICAAGPASAQVIFSIDYKGARNGATATGTGVIRESDLLLPPLGMPSFAAVQPPQILGTGGQLGLSQYTVCISPGPGFPCHIEVDALSMGTDRPFVQSANPNAQPRLFFSVDVQSVGVPAGLPPTMFTQALQFEAAADLYTPYLLPQPPLDILAIVPPRNVLVLDGNGAGPSPHHYRGLGLVEPYTVPMPPPPPAPPYMINGDDLDAVTILGPGPTPTHVFFSLDASFIDPLTGIPNSGSAAAAARQPGAILSVPFPLTGATPVEYAAPVQLGLDLFGAGTDDLDALIVFENGIPGYQKSQQPYDWVPGFPGGQKDMVVFSIRRGSRLVQNQIPDSIFGRPIEEGDLLVPPFGTPLATVPPGIWIAAEDLGLRTRRTHGAAEGDELDAASTGDICYDCNGNGIEDAVDIATGYSVDMNGNGIPDECDSKAFCFGDGTLIDHTTPCPCSNSGAAGHGCAHSFDPAGANLTATGIPSSDDIVLVSSTEPTRSFTLFMQHDAPDDRVFHDGVLCAGGTLVRLRGRNASAGSATFPDPVWDSSITLSQRGSVTVGSGVRRYYAAWYRNASTTFCPPATANVTNGWVIDW